MTLEFSINIFFKLVFCKSWVNDYYDILEVMKRIKVYILKKRLTDTIFPFFYHKNISSVCSKIPQKMQLLII